MNEDDNKRRIVFERKIEKRVIKMIMDCRKVNDIWDKNKLVKYRNDEGKKKRNVLEFIEKIKNGRRVEIEVKN